MQIPLAAANVLGLIIDQKLSLDEAYAILGLDKNASKEDISLYNGQTPPRSENRNPRVSPSETRLATERKMLEPKR